MGQKRERLYLTIITPEQARPLFSAEDAKLYELYFRDRKIPKTLGERIKVMLLGLKFKWQHSVERRLRESGSQKAIPVGSHKLESVVFVGTTMNNPSLKRDEHGEIFVERPIRANSDPEFQMFGPFSTRDVQNGGLY